MATQNLSHTYPPMEAQTVSSIPEGRGWQYEPKWDGFRCLAFCENGEVDLRSKNGQPLGRYFPEIVQALQKLEANDFVLDGEIVIRLGDSLSFDDLLQRIHPAESRIRKLSVQTPATYILFDLLATNDGRNLSGLSLLERRRELEKFEEQFLLGSKTVCVTPVTSSADIAKKWLSQHGTFLDGIVAKRADLSYQSGNRKGMVKVKRLRTVDCVVGGFRYGANSKQIGSLLLGLYDDEGELHHVGFTSAFSAQEKQELTGKFEKLQTQTSFTANVPGGPSRWSTERSMEWVPVKPVQVVEVRYDHFTGGRFRHGTKIVRWRPEKAPEQCKLDQLEKQ